MVLMVNFASALSRAEASMAPETSPSQSEWVVIENVFPAFIASCMVYLASMALDSENLDLSKIALVAAIGDRQDKGEGKTMLGENAKVLKTAVDAGFVESFQDLLLVGRETRPLADAMAFTARPFIEGVTWNHKACLEILKLCNIPLKNGSRWRVPAELSQEEKDIAGYGAEKASFVFHTTEDLFERDSESPATFVSAYYLEYDVTEEDVSNVASVVVKRDRICTASMCSMNVLSPIPQKFDFPYSDMVVLEISAEQSHKKVNKYCEKTRRNAQYCGIAMNNMAAFSILERLK